MEDLREIPYNYTSADDRQVVTQILGEDSWEILEKLKEKRVTGRSSKLLMRFIGDMFIVQRNPFLFQELLDSKSRRRRFFNTAKSELELIDKATEDPDVRDIVGKCNKHWKSLKKSLSEVSKKRQEIIRKIGPVVGVDNIYFDPFSLVSHATDATDWRLFLPTAVIRPDRESQVAPLMKAIEEMNLFIIPRGAGTGLTGGAVPVSPECVMINLEKLNRIHGITHQTMVAEDGSHVKQPVMTLESGVITDAAMAHAAEAGLVFATDPTSSWASTIGGNIAENAGGKTAVLWGTAIDNIISYNISMPGGERLSVHRTNHPMRKIKHQDQVVFEVRDEFGKPVREIDLTGADFRKANLGKDITNKTLGGLPGIQKEGTDGIITSATFILYKGFEHKKTFCLEFFGDDMEEASKVIVELSREFKNNGEETLIALEHFDDAYVKAVNYKVKAARSESPKAVLLIDMAAHTPEQIERGCKKLSDLLTPYPNSSLFTARDEKEAVRFWRDRKRLGAISSHTNAFKLNEDIVLPLEKLAEFARYVDDYNAEEDRFNQKDYVRKVAKYLKDAEPIEDPDWLEAKLPKARELCDAALKTLDSADRETLEKEKTVKQLIESLLVLFRGYKRVSGNIEDLYRDVRSRRIILATHMHAGDGNVHVNIPVFSNDRDMMNRAQKSADDIMEKAVELEGVVSGEHGIGITKIKYLESSRIEELNRYRAKVDPRGTMNPGKLTDAAVADQVFTPSFNLLGLEAQILQHSSLRDLALRIANCVRCGKCKVTCSTFYPAGNMFMHPRNKNLAIASLIEALLYDVQRSHSTRFKHLKYLEEIADHCNMCGKCFKPCPVDIDTSKVSVLEREILSDRKFKHTAAATKMTLQFLQSQSRVLNYAFRQGVVKWGGTLQRKGAEILPKLPKAEMIKGTRMGQMLSSPIPPADPSTLRKILPPCSKDEALMVNPQGDVRGTVFYFPGCGSERLFSVVSKASLYILLKSGHRVVLPPPYLCCGFPARVNAQKTQHGSLTLRNTIIFSQIREMLSYIDFKACVISCGTCCESLSKAGAGNIFDCDVQDVNRFVLDSGIKLPNTDGKGGERNVLYHAPCHDSLEGKARELLESHTDYKVKSVPHCCSEAGTLSLSRPDISGCMLDRKTQAVSQAVEGTGGKQVMLTNCPSCLSGLGRIGTSSITPRHMAEDLALMAYGRNWEKDLLKILEKTERVTF